MTLGATESGMNRGTFGERVEGRRGANSWLSVFNRIPFVIDTFEKGFDLDCRGELLSQSQGLLCRAKHPGTKAGLFKRTCDRRQWAKAEEVRLTPGQSFLGQPVFPFQFK
jgi:hypothetical protein